MLLILPFSVLILLSLILVSLQSETTQERDWRIPIIQAAALWGAYIALSTEFLSLTHALSTTGICLAWLVFHLLLLAIQWRDNRLLDGSRILLSSIRSLTTIEWLFFAGFMAILAVLLTVSIITPANTTDSLQYHMSRVMHWAQNQSLRHYATAFAPQLMNPIWAEETILHLRLLFGDDSLANVVQWFGLVCSLIGVSLIAKLVGANRKGQWAAAAFCLSLPMGILQSTTTQNDFVVAFWLVCIISLALLSALRPLSRFEHVSFALVLGVGLLTKGTFYPYALPVAMFYFLYQVQQDGWHTAFLRGLYAAGNVLVLNSGYWIRNMITFGSPLGSSDWIQHMTASHRGVLSVVSSLVRNILINFVTPFEAVNNQMVEWMRSTFGSYDPNLAEFRLFWGWNHNDMAGNPLHALLLFLTLFLILVLRRRFKRRIFWHALLLLGTLYLMLSLVIKFDLWGIRYQLPFWVAFSPIFGATLSKINQRNLSAITVLALLTTAIPWLLFNRSRPIIAMRNVQEKFTIPCYFGCTGGSILNEPKTSTLFANWIALREPYMAMTADIAASSCKDVGLRIDSHDLEYVFWWLLEAPQNTIHIETIYPLPELQRYKDPEFEPCAAICTICTDEASIYDLPLYHDYGNVKLYLTPSLVPLPQE